jgi:hypothetical protein
MTLPFRGRHHDQESTHDRARALISSELIEPLTEDESTWLARHLESCAECTRDRAAYAADSALLRGFRETSPEPPRDLWARTSAAIDREAGARRRGPAGAAAANRPRSRWGGLPLGAAAGALVAVVVLVTAIIPRTIPQVVPPVGSDVAVVSLPPVPPPQPTPLAVAAGDIGYMRPAANGRWELVISKVDEVCPRSRPGCELDEETPGQTVDLGNEPTGVTMSPAKDQLLVQSRGTSGGAQPDKVYVVALASAAPTGTDSPPTDSPPTEPPLTDPPVSPGSSPTATPSETPGSTPTGAIEIASGVTLVGEAAYSADGKRLAFSARPADGSAGPDLYLYEDGDKSATQVTDDHRTYFSGWLGDRVLASRVLVPEVLPGELPGASGDPASPTDAPASTEALASPTTGEFHATSFLLDPATGEMTNLSQPDVWLPVVDPARRVTAYWSGTLVPTADGLDWNLGEGQLVLDRWVEPGSAPSPSAPAAASSDPATEPTADPSSDPSAAPLEVVGPAGDATPLDVGDVAVFKALFDPEGSRLAIWTSEDPAAEFGRLNLVVLDPETGTVDADLKPLAGEPALRRFSIDKGRLAWVSPRGQDGQESAVQVLGWRGRNFGEIQTIPAKDLFIVR